MKFSKTALGLVATVFVPVAAVKVIAAAAQPTPFDALFNAEAGSGGFWHDAAMLKAIAHVESNFNPNAVSPPNTNGTKDYGLTQINENTARGYGVDPLSIVGDAALSIHLTARVLSDASRALGSILTSQTLVSAYNEGAGNVIARGILNWSYVSRVLWWQFIYSMQASA